MSADPLLYLARAALLAALLCSGCGITPTGSIVVLGPAGGRVEIDGHPRGTIPREGLVLERVPTGTRALRVELDGHFAAQLSVVVDWNQRIQLAVGPLVPVPAAPDAPELDPTEQLALEQARAFFGAGDGEAALVVLGGRRSPALDLLRARVAQVVALWREAEAYRAAGLGDRARQLLEQLLAIEPDPANAYHQRARRIAR